MNEAKKIETVILIILLFLFGIKLNEDSKTP
jgi:uncharacterized membrane protein YbjE (DUF340 family)